MKNTNSDIGGVAAPKPTTVAAHKSIAWVFDHSAFSVTAIEPS